MADTIRITGVYSAAKGTVILKESFLNEGTVLDVEDIRSDYDDNGMWCRFDGYPNVFIPFYSVVAFICKETR